MEKTQYCADWIFLWRGCSAIHVNEFFFRTGVESKSPHFIIAFSQTDFEIHVMQMLGWGKNSGESVPAEINKIFKPVIFIVGDDEKEFPFSHPTIKNKEIIKMPGGHHYDGDVNALSKQIVAHL